MPSMIDVEIVTPSATEWMERVAGLGPANLLQTWEYGEAKAKTSAWSVERGCVRDGNTIIGAFQALTRPLPAGLPGGLVWINRGPLLMPAMPTARVVEVMTAIRRHYVDERRRYLRIAPAIPDTAWADRETQAAAFETAGSDGWASDVVDLTQSSEQLRGRLRSNWRNHLNQAERSGIEVRSGTDSESFALFLDHHLRMIADKGIVTSVTSELLAALQELLPPERKMQPFLAYDGDRLQAWALIVRYGASAEYLAGGAAETGRKRNAGQLALWRAMGAMKEAGVRRFDLGGMDQRTTPSGIYLFKTGVGGQAYRLAPEIEAVGGAFGRLVRWHVRRSRMAA